MPTLEESIPPSNKYAIEIIGLKPEFGEGVWLALIVDTSKEPNLVIHVEVEDMAAIIECRVSVWSPNYPLKKYLIHSFRMYSFSIVGVEEPLHYPISVGTPIEPDGVFSPSLHASNDFPVGTAEQ